MGWLFVAVVVGVFGGRRLLYLIALVLSPRAKLLELLDLVRFSHGFKFELLELLLRCRVIGMLNDTETLITTATDSRSVIDNCG